jgi:nucleoside-diphosphate-sugar epimerase
MKISIIACGWLGLPLGEYLVNKGNLVKGSTTRISKLIILQNAGIEPYFLNLNPEIESENFSELIDSELIIINIPPRVAKNGENFHLEQIQNLTKKILNNFKNKVLPKIIFISSTSVYPENNQIATESSTINENHILIKVENLLKNSFEKLTILRFGGLMGYERFPGNYYAGKPFTNWASGVNYVHQDDAIQVINHIIEHNIWSETFNICSPIHPPRKQIIERNCSDLGLELPQFSEVPSTENFKIISPEKLISQTKYKFKYLNPLEFFYQKEI